MDEIFEFLVLIFLSEYLIFEFHVKVLVLEKFGIVGSYFSDFLLQLIVFLPLSLQLIILLLNLVVEPVLLLSNGLVEFLYLLDEVGLSICLLKRKIHDRGGVDIIKIL